MQFLCKGAVKVGGGIIMSEKGKTKQTQKKSIREKAVKEL